MKLLREPLVHFLFIGAAIYLFYWAFAEPVPEEADKTVVVTAGEVQWMQTSWQKRWNRPPTTEEFEGLIEQYIREAILYREALNLGLNQHDAVIRRRLAQKMEYLAEGLVQLTPPTDDELLAYFEAYLERYQKPARYTFTHVYINPDKRGKTTLDDAEKIKATLIAQGHEMENAGALGDHFLQQHDYADKEQAEIEKLFGSGFAESLVDLSPGQWHGPVLSGYGVHLVYVSNVSEPPQPVFAELREEVVQHWTTEKSEELNETFYAKLRDQYTIVVEEPEKKVELATLREPAQ